MTLDGRADSYSIEATQNSILDTVFGMFADLLVKDNFIEDVAALRADVLSKGFQTVTCPGDGLDYKGVQIRDPQEFDVALCGLFEAPVKINANVARIHYKGEGGKNAVHADHSLGEHAAVLYLTPKGVATGTAFWTDKLTGWEEMPTKDHLIEKGLSEAEVVARLVAQASDISKWVNNAFVAARPGRIIAYPTKRFHSRFPFSPAFGDTPETARLVITLFFDRA